MRPKHERKAKSKEWCSAHTLIFHANEKLKRYTAILDAFSAYFEADLLYASQPKIKLKVTK